MSDKAYTSESKINSYLNTTITTGAAANYILAAQAFIEKYTGRNFKADTTASARYFDGKDKQYIDIDDCVEVTKVEVGSNEWGDSFTEVTNPNGGIPGYYTLPRNAIAEGEPIDKIGLRSLIFIWGTGNHRITAKWGYSAAVPDDISLAATIIAAGMYFNKNRGGKAGAVSGKRIGNYQISYANQEGLEDFKGAMEILDSYKDIPL